MKDLQCLKCGKEANSYKEFASAKCNNCGGIISEEEDDDLTASHYGMDSDL